MIQSMTGYGKATAIFGEKKINVEIKSLIVKQWTCLHGSLLYTVKRNGNPQYDFQIIGTR